MGPVRPCGRGLRRVCSPLLCPAEVPVGLPQPRVKSISASGHKFGLSPWGAALCCGGTGRICRSSLCSTSTTWGGDMAVFQLNFSRPAGPVICQYYQLLRLGFAGYRKIHMNCYKNRPVPGPERLRLPVPSACSIGGPRGGHPRPYLDPGGGGGRALQPLRLCRPVAQPGLAGARLCLAARGGGDGSPADPGSSRLRAEYGPTVSGGLPPHGGLLRPPRGGPQPDPAGGGGASTTDLASAAGTGGAMPFQILRNGREKVRRMPPSTRPTPCPRIGRGAGQAIYAAAGSRPC